MLENEKQNEEIIVNTTNTPLVDEWDNHIGDIISF